MLLFTDKLFWNHLSNFMLNVSASYFMLAAAVSTFKQLSQIDQFLTLSFNIFAAIIYFVLSLKIKQILGKYE